MVEGERSVMRERGLRLQMSGMPPKAGEGAGVPQTWDAGEGHLADGSGR